MNILKQDVKDYLIQQLQDDVGLDNDINDLHHYLINEDYFIIGYNQARKWLEKESVFEAIDKIKDYEQSNFGEVTTDFTDEEKTANMLAYVLADEILNENNTYQLFSRMSGNFDENKRDLLVDSLENS
jgi:GDP-D-mannose dehydratase|tara:strand:- start:554 stop:937 length:384 start_codon:yes stop_codon:yes gene_type:complete